jgi:hypothetical protein
MEKPTNLNIIIVAFMPRVSGPKIVPRLLPTSYGFSAYVIGKDIGENSLAR